MLITFNCPHCGSSLEVEGSSAGAQAQCPQCKASMTIPRKGVEPGTTVGGFRIEKLLGEGGMGRVFLARQLNMDRNVALKILPAALTMDKALVERFLNEVRVSARLEHPTIVRAYDTGEDDGVYYMAIEYVRGETLEDRLEREGAMPEREALTMARKLAAALQYAWNKHRILHRDIKPSNVMLDQDAQPRLTDMGLSKSLAESGNLTLTGTVMGTPNYMSPEQAKGECDLDQRTDIYSLGATLYHMVTGEVPFASTSVLAVLQKQINEPLPDPRESNPEVSEECVSLLEIMLAKEAAERYATWGDLISDLDWVLEGREPKQQRPGASTLMRMGAGPKKKMAVGHSTLDRMHELQKETPASKKRSKVPPLIGAVVLLLALAGGGGLVLRQKQKTEARQRAAALATEQRQQEEAERQRAEADTARQALEQQLADALAYSEQKPDDYDGAVERLQAAADAGTGTDIAQRAQAAITKLEAARGRAVAAMWKQLQDEAEALFNAGEADLAVSTLRDYFGPLSDETMQDRERLAAQYERTIAKARETEARERREAEAKVTTLLNALADDLLAMDFASASAKITEAGQDAMIKTAPGWEETERVMARVTTLPEVILQSFNTDIGEEVTVELTTGTETLQINGENAGAVLAKKIIRSGGRVVAYTDRNFTLEDLSWRDKFRRLGTQREPALDVMRGLLVYAGGATDKAREFLHGSDTALGGILAGRTEALTRATATAEQVEEHAELRAAALTDLQKLLALLGSDLGTLPHWTEALQRNGLPATMEPINELAQAIRRHAFSKQMVSKLRSECSVFRREHGQTPVARKAEPLLVALEGVTTMPRQVDPEVIRQAIADLKALNPRVEHLFSDVSTSADGLHLDLSGNAELADISPLANLPLVELNLSETKVEDLRPLDDLPLEILDLSFCPIESLEPLRGLPLKDLNLAATFVDNISPLAGMPLTSLHLQGSKNLTSVRAIRDMPLEDLTMVGCQISDLSDLKGLHLKSLHVAHVPIRDLNPLEGMQLSRLVLISCRTPDLRPLSGMPLAELRLSHVYDLRDLSPLQGMPLKELSIVSCNQITDLKSLSGMQLKSLDLADTAVVNLEPLRGMLLDSLRLDRTRVRDLDPLAGMPLRTLLLTETPVKDLAPLKGMNLTLLSLAGTEVEDLTLLRDVAVYTLSLVEAPVKDLIPLEGKSISTLYLNDSLVTDLTPLRGVPLVTLTLTPGNIDRGIEMVRDSETLRSIGTSANTRLHPAEFWKRYDAGEFK